jgi:hypothetical protein
LILAALAAPFLLAVAQRRLIPSWYEASVRISAVVLLWHVVAMAVTVRGVWRNNHWGWRRRLGLGAVALLTAGGATVTTWFGALREGAFMCDRELRESAPCADGGEAFRFERMCILGNPRVEVEVRPTLLPFMYPAHEGSIEEACAALRR